jgi:ribosomal protein S18 acetylase RimI-like enzyme
VDRIAIARLVERTPRTVEQINRLVPQLKPAWPPITDDRLDVLLASPTRVYVATDDDDEDGIVGLALLVPHHHVPGLRFHVEDVVVDVAHRGAGIGRALLTTAMADAPDEVLSFDLRSHRSRTAAHRLYRSLGFEPSETTVFRRPADPIREDPRGG